MVSRRDALKRMGAMAAGAAIGCSPESASGAGAAGEATGEATAASNASPIGAIGVQLYTVRAEMANGVESTLERVAAIGYEEVESAGYFGHSPTEVREMLARPGLRSPATHVLPAFDPDPWAPPLAAATRPGSSRRPIAALDPMQARHAPRPGAAR